MPEQEGKGQVTETAPKKKGVLGCSFPVFIIAAVVLLVIFVIGFLAGPIGKSIVPGVKLPAWLSVPQPEPELPSEVVFHLFGFPISNSILASWLTMLVLVVFCFIITRRLKAVPGKGQALLELIVGSLLDFCQSIAGKENGRKFFPIVATIFLYVIFNAWLSLLPIFGPILVHTSQGEVHLLKPANTDLNTPLSIAIMSFIFVEYYGLKTLKLNYLKKFINVGTFFGGVGKLLRGKVGAGVSGIFLGIINIFIGLVETMSELVRMVSFTLRLFGNMTAGEILLIMITFLVPFLAADVFYALEIFVGLIQAVIFSVLTLIFLNVAVTSHEHAEHSEEA